MDQKVKNVNTRFLPAPASNVGFARFTLVDANRRDFVDHKKNRHFEVLAWYPTDSKSDANRKPYLANHNARNLSHLFFRLGSKKIHEVVSGVKTNSFEGVPVSDRRERYPVLLFSHDLAMLPEYYTTLMEHLASEGYFIFSINHPYLSEECVIRDDSEKTARIFKLNKWNALQWAMALFSARKKLIGKTYNEKWAKSRRFLNQWRAFHDAHSTMAADRKFLLNFLEAMNSMLCYSEYPYKLFSKRLDLSRVGAMGHGWGGASAVDSLIHDPRIKAAINIDGLQFSNAMNQTISKPLFMIYSKQYDGVNEGIYFNASENHVHTINNSKHYSFTDLPFINALTQDDSQVLYHTVNLAVHFLDRHLKQVDHLQLIRSRQNHL